MNKWKRAFLTGYPVLSAPALVRELPDSHPDSVLWVKIAVESDRRDEEVSDLIPHLLQEALGERALKQAQRDNREAVELGQETYFICHRAALMACYHQDLRRAPTPQQIAGQIRKLLLTPSEREEAAQAQRWRALLRTSAPYNRLPC